MRTSEFIAKIKERGYETCTDQNFVNVINGSGRDLISISSNMEFSLANCSLDFSFISKDDKKRLFELSVEYASTPIAEREEEKRYRVKLISKSIEEDVSYLNKWVVEGRYFLSDLSSTTDVKTIFTESELETMDLTGFEKVEVTE